MNEHHVTRDRPPPTSQTPMGRQVAQLPIRPAPVLWDMTRPPPEPAPARPTPAQGLSRARTPTACQGSDGSALRDAARPGTNSCGRGLLAPPLCGPYAMNAGARNRPSAPTASRPLPALTRASGSTSPSPADRGRSRIVRPSSWGARLVGQTTGAPPLLRAGRNIQHDGRSNKLPGTS